MNLKRFIVSSIVVFLAFEVMELVIHMGILKPTYQALAHLWRPEADMMSKMWILHASTLFFSFLFVYIFSKGYENKGLAEGLRYGLVIGLLMNIPIASHNHVIYPVPLSLCLQWLLYGTIEFILAGLVLAVVYRKA